MLADDLDDALFLDIDGALLESAPTPDSVRVPHELIELLYRLSVVLDGAIALVSGRPVDVDRLFKPFRFATLGVHGCERRGVDGELRLPSVDARSINLLHDECCRFVGDSPDLMAEYKACGVAIHYCLAPERAENVREYLEGLAHRAGPAFSVIEGQHVCEIKPAANSRAAAIHEMLTPRPFPGTTPDLHRRESSPGRLRSRESRGRTCHRGGHRRTHGRDAAHRQCCERARGLRNPVGRTCPQS